MLKHVIEDNKMVFMFPNKLDTTSAMTIETELHQILSSPENNEKISEYIFNLKDVEYICSSFLRCCLKIAKHVGEHQFVITNVNPVVFKVFKITGFDKILKIELADWNF